MKEIFKDILLPILIALICLALVFGGLITTGAIVKKCDAVKTELILKDVKKAEDFYRGESLQILEPVLEMKTEEINVTYQRIQEQKVTHFVWSAYQSFTNLTGVATRYLNNPKVNKEVCRLQVEIFNKQMEMIKSTTFSDPRNHSDMLKALREEIYQMHECNNPYYVFAKDKYNDNFINQF